MKSIPRIICLISLVVLLPINSQDKNSLLRRPWIPTASAEEEQVYNKIQSTIKIAPSFVVKQDRWGRNYKLKANGEIEYLLDEMYFKKFPDKIDTNLAFAEAKTLYKNGFWLESLHLLDGILLCERVGKTKKNLTSRIEKQTSLQKNRILNSNSDHLDEILAFADPYGCYLENRLKLESASFSYNLDLPSNWSWIYFRDKEEISGKTDALSYKSNILFKKIENLDTNPLNADEDFLQKYQLANKNELYLKKNRILFFIGTTNENKPIFNQENYFSFWDTKRGLTDATKRNLKFIRIKNSIGYQSKFIQVDSLGVPTEMIINEFYYWKNGKGIFLALSFPSFIQAEANQDWINIIQSFQVKGSDVRLY